MEFVSRRPIVATVLCILGLGAASYLTYIHFTSSASISCLAIKGINCEKVITSPQSLVFGVPVAILGLAFFVAMLALCVPPAWRSQQHFIAPARLVGAVTGVGFICYLLYAELFEIRAICIWCTAVHVLTFLLFVTIATGWDDALDLREAAAEG